jgi:hypothetical protein
MEQEPVLQMGADRMKLRCAYHKPFMVMYPDKCEWRSGFNLGIEGGLVWHMDGSKIYNGIGAGCTVGLKRRHTFSLGLHTTVFQVETHSTKACVMENIEKGCRGDNMYIFSASQVAIKALESFQMNLKLVSDWQHITGCTWYGCQDIWSLMEMKLLIS